MFLFRIIIFLKFSICIFSLQVQVEENVKNVVRNFLNNNDMRFKTFTVALQLAKDRNAKTYIETGTSRAPKGSCRGDGCSTYIFSAFNQLLDDERVEMYSVDISEKNCQICSKNTESFGKYAVKVIKSDSVKFIEDWPIDKKIDFMYLDSFDFSWGREVESQEHHLKELMASLNKIHDETIIFMDDCRLRMGGKCAKVREYLLKNDWKIVIDEYQTLFVKN